VNCQSMVFRVLHPEGLGVERALPWFLCLVSYCFTCLETETANPLIMGFYSSVSVEIILPPFKEILFCHL